MHPCVQAYPSISEKLYEQFKEKRNSLNILLHPHVWQTQANPSFSEKLYEQFKKKKNSLNKVTKEDIINKYGNVAGAWVH